MQIYPLMCITHIHTENGDIAELGHLDSEGNLVWRLSRAAVMILCRAGARFYVHWRGTNYEVYLQTATLYTEAQLRTRADGRGAAVLKLLPEFGYEREKLRKAA